MSDEGLEARRLKRGRPSKKHEILARMSVVLDPSATGKMVFGEGAAAEDLIEATGLEAKLSAISTKITSRLEKAGRNAKIVQDSEEDEEFRQKLRRPWSDGDSPENLVSSCEEQFFANDRVISALLAHLVEHIVIGEDLRSMAASARRQAADELNRLPSLFIDFSNRLIASGVKAHDVKDLSKKRMAMIVSAIKGIDEEAALVDIPNLPDKSLSDVYGRNEFSGELVEDKAPTLVDAISSEAETDADEETAEIKTSGLIDVSEALNDENAAVTDMSSSTIEGEETTAVIASEEIEETPVEADQSDAPTAGEPVVSPDAAPVSLGVLDGIDLSSIGYKIEVVRASTDEDLAALKMPMPNGQSLYDVTVSSGLERTLANNVVRMRDRDSVDRFFRRWTDRTSTRLTPIQMRAWTLMLAEIPFLGKERDMGSDGWYDGVRIPVVGTNWVARIIAIDRSDDGLKESLIHNPTTLL